eukprot:1002377-Prymnesium_polylepis.2
MEGASAISGARGARTHTNSQLPGPTTHRAAGAGETTATHQVYPFKCSVQKQPPTHSDLKAVALTNR